VFGSLLCLNLSKMPWFIEQLAIRWTTGLVILYLRIRSLSPVVGAFHVIKCWILNNSHVYCLHLWLFLCRPQGNWLPLKESLHGSRSVIVGQLAWIDMIDCFSDFWILLRIPLCHFIGYDGFCLILVDANLTLSYNIFFQNCEIIWSLNYAALREGSHDMRLGCLIGTVERSSTPVLLSYLTVMSQDSIF
jgi:hypothetical protein